MTFKVGTPISWPKRAQSREAQRKRKKTLAATMEKRRREKNAWYCQLEGSKHYGNESKYYICQECFDKLKKLSKNEKEI